MGDTTPSTGAMSRRNLLRAGGLGVAGAAFLAACSKGDGEGGISGPPVSATSVPPTVPTTDPPQTALDADKVQLRTAQSVELLAVDVYGTYGPQLTSAEWRTTAERFKADHAATAKVYAAAATPTKQSSQPNEYLMDNFVGLAKEGLNDDTSILNFFASMESMITANCINATGIYTGADWRQQSMAFGAAAARRVSVLGDGGNGVVPDTALYPLVDLMPGDAYLVPVTKAPA